MDDTSRSVRAMLRSMAPAASIPYIQRFQLPEEEERVLIECDVRQRSVQQVAQAMSLSPETGKRRRRHAQKNHFAPFSEPFSLTKDKFYAALADAFLNDDDARPDKLAWYYEYIVE